jgi:replication factor A1
MTESFLPICELSAYHRKWVIKARVTNKAPLRTFSKGMGEGKVFHIELLDAMGGEIKASFFNHAADKYFDTLENGKCFTFSQGSVRIANRQYNRTSHRYELIFDKEALVALCDEDSSIETVKFSFVTLRTLQTRALPCTVDLCGVVSSFKPHMAFSTREGKELVKREVTIVDDTATSMVVTLWGERAQQPDKMFEGNPVVTFKSVSIKEWNGSRSGSSLQSGTFTFNATSPEAKRVQEWWSQGGSSQEVLQLSEAAGNSGEGRARNATQTNLAGVRRAAESISSQPELFSVVARLGLVQTRKQGEPQPLHYMACQEPKEGNGWPCNKRVDEQGFCASCNRAGKVAPRLNVRCRFMDYEEQAWLTSFHEAACKILEMSAEEVRAMEEAAAQKGEAGREELEAVIRKSYFQKPMNVTVRAKLDHYNGETRTNVTVVDARPVSYADHGRQMLKDIHELLAY